MNSLISQAYVGKKLEGWWQSIVANLLYRVYVEIKASRKYAN